MDVESNQGPPAVAKSSATGPLLVAGAAMALSTLFLAGYVAAYRMDLSSLVCADRSKIGHWPFEEVRIGFGTDGFDGQFYYVIARAPWQKQVAFVDHPSYRHARIVYPSLAWLVAGGGDAKRLLWALPAVNILSIAAMAWLGAAVARRFAKSPWWGLALPLMVNAIPPMLRDLTDPVATLGAIAVVAGWLLRWPAWSLAMLCSLAVLAREQNLAIVAIVGLECLVARQFKRAALAAIALPIWLCWINVMHAAYGTWPFYGGNTEGPFDGFRHRLQHMSGPLGSPDSWIHSVAMATLVLQMLATAAHLVSRSDRLSWLVGAMGLALAAMAGASIYGNLESYTRVFWWMPFGVWLWAIQSERRWPVFLSCIGLLWPLYAVAQAWHKAQSGGVTILGP